MTVSGTHRHQAVSLSDGLCGQEESRRVHTVRRAFQARFPAHPARAAAVRRMVVAHLNYWRLGDQDDLVEVTALATSELFANAVAHGCAGPEDIVRVSVERSEHELRVEVTDPSPVMPMPRMAAVAEESGRGLTIVAALVGAWGTEPDTSEGTGKTVWFTLPLKEAS